ncbi:MAG: Dabb family protein [Gemmatimonadota bacterium]
MIQHIVCIRFKVGTTAGQIAHAGSSLLSLKGRIPEIHDIRWGPNLGPSSAEYTHVLTVVLDDMAAVARYLAHPVHVQVVAEALAPIREARLAIDFEG